MSRIVLNTSGSFGDVHPYIAVGLALRDRGHHVTIATAEFYRSKITGEGLHFHPVRPDFVPMRATPETIRRSFDPVRGANFVLKSLILPFVEQSYEDLLKACRGADLLVIHPTQFAAPLVAEKLELPWVSVVLSPAVFVSAYDPPVFPPFPWVQRLRSLGPVPHKLLVGGMKSITRGWMAPILDLRRREKLGAGRGCPMHDDMFSPFGTLAWFSPLLAGPQPDWPAETRITGFPVYDKNSAQQGLSPGLRRFLESGPAPVVFTLGSSAVVDAGDFFEQSVDAVRSIGCRAIFLIGEGSAAEFQVEANDSIAIEAYAPYSELFPRAAAVVHQGGIGTLGQGLRAGVPMLVVPQGLDQPDNAARAARLGVARVLPRKHYVAGKAVDYLRELLTKSDFVDRARWLGQQLQTEDGAASACDALEQVLASTAVDSRTIP